MHISNMFSKLLTSNFYQLLYNKRNLFFYFHEFEQKEHTNSLVIVFVYDNNSLSILCHVVYTTIGFIVTKDNTTTPYC